MNKKLAGAGAAAVAAAAAATVLMLGATSAVAGESGGDSSAYGIAAAGLVKIDPTPFVESTDGSPQHAQLAGLPANGSLSAGLLTVDAEAGKASSTTANLNVTGVLTATLITVTCDNGEGSVSIAGGSLLGTALPSAPAAGQKIDASPLATVTLGEQTRNDDGTLTVTGVKLSVLPGGALPSTPLTSGQKASLPDLGGLLGVQIPSNASTIGDVLGALPVGGTASGAAQTVTIGSATCGAKTEGDHGGDQWGDGDHGDDNGDHQSSDNPSDTGTAPGEAPTPDVVKANLPVTG